MPHCCVKSCRNHSDLKLKGITFHRIPVKHTLEWLSAMHMSADEFNSHHRVCSAHFERDCFIKYPTSRVYLKENAIPTLRLGDVMDEDIKQNINTKLISFVPSTASMITECFKGPLSIKSLKKLSTKSTVQPTVLLSGSALVPQEATYLSPMITNDPILNIDKMLSQVDFGSICRVCLMHSIDMKNLSQIDEESPGNLTVTELLRKCASVQVEEGDGLPQQVCLKCFGQLRVHISFEELVKSSDTALRNHLVSESKLHAFIAGSDDNNKISEQGIKQLNDVVDNIGTESNEAKKQYVHPNTIASIYSDHCYTGYPNLKNKQIYKCRYCSETFTMRRKYHHHVLGHRAVIYKCDQCPKTFKSINMMIRHNRTHTKKNVKEKSPETIKNQQKKRKSSETIKNQQTDKTKQTNTLNKKLRTKPSNPCHFCGKVLNSSASLVLHIRTHTGERPHMCHLCGKTFSQQPHLKRHQLVHAGIKNAICEICGKKFLTVTSLKCHLRRHTQVRNYSCKQCPMKFTFPGALNTHIRAVHKGERPFKCTFCEISYASRQALNRHLEATHADCNNAVSENPFPCDKCARSFMRLSHLEAHYVVHKDGIKRLDCQVCGKVFVNRVGLRVHVLRHGPSRIHQCHICKRSFNDPAVLDAHVRFHQRPKPFECTSCHKRFLDSSALRVHNRTHTGERPFECTICQKRFTAKKTLVAHNMRNHFGILPYECTECPKKFATRGTLSTHLLIVHSIG